MRPCQAARAAALLVLGALPLWAGDSVEYVPARSYCEAARREISRAKSSVTVCLYLFSLRSHDPGRDVFQLAQSLVKARDAGARVEVFLDNNGPAAGDSPESPGQGFNGPAGAYLKAQGIPVRQDDSSALVHAKAIVIDEETVLLGSTNWTDAALNKNMETNVLVRSKAVARDVLAEIHRVPWREIPAPADDGGAEVPGSFLAPGGPFGRMAAARDERSLDVCLLLLRETGDPFTVNMNRMTAGLGIDGWTREASRRQIFKTLNKLQNRYGLIRVESSFGKDPRVAWTSPREGAGARIPDRYWSLGWSGRLSLAGKWFLLISQAESSAAVTRPRWSAARTALADRYGLSPGFISRGVTDLRRQNLLEVEYGPLGKNGPQDRPPNIYTPNPLYDPAENDARLKELIAQHGPDAASRAQKAAALLYEDNDLNVRTELIDLESRYGRARLSQALRVLARMNPDNPKRTFPYLKGIVRTE